MKLHTQGDDDVNSDWNVIQNADETCGGGLVRKGLCLRVAIGKGRCGRYGDAPFGWWTKVL